MGTDIHTACEVRRDGYWLNSGPLFDSDYDWNSRVVFNALDAVDIGDFHLVKGLHTQLDSVRGVEKEHSQTGVIRARIPMPLCVELDEKLAQVHAAMRESQAFYESCRTAKGGWDYYGVVRPGQHKILKACRDSLTLSGDLRLAIIDSLVAYNRPWADAEDPYEEVEGFEGKYAVDISLDRLDDEPPHKTGHPYQGRNYFLFAHLANVRNGFGFAGLPTHAPIKPIDDPRGLPGDVTPESLKLISHEHSQSWLTLSELEEHTWDQRVMHVGVVPENVYLAMRDLKNYDPGNPGLAEYLGTRHVSYCGDISGMNIHQFHTPEEYEAWVADNRPPLANRDRVRADEAAVLTKPEVYVRVNWMEGGEGFDPAKSISDHFFNHTLPTMRSLIPEGGTADDVRMVFDFDS